LRQLGATCSERVRVNDGRAGLKNVKCLGGGTQAEGKSIWVGCGGTRTCMCSRRWLLRSTAIHSMPSCVFSVPTPPSSTAVHWGSTRHSHTNTRHSHTNTRHSHTNSSIQRNPRARRHTHRLHVTHDSCTSHMPLASHTSHMPLAFRTNLTNTTSTPPSPPPPQLARSQPQPRATVQCAGSHPSSGSSS
jgi:hypothetical protein